MTQRITKIVSPRNPDLDTQDEIVRRLQAAPTTPLIHVPTGLAETIRSIAQLEFGGRCAFVQLLRACLSLPEFRLPPTDDLRDRLVARAIDAQMVPEDRVLYRTVLPVVSDAREIPLMVAEAMRQSPEWDVIVVPPSQYSSQRLVFQLRSSSGQI